MNYRSQIIWSCILLFLVHSAYAQIPDELVNKARAAGLSETQIRQQITKYAEQLNAHAMNQTVIGDTTITDRSSLLQAQDVSVLQEKPVADLQKVVFGREIFSNKQLTFEPDLNIPTPANYILSAGDELLIHVWGDSELNLKLKISPEGTILIPGLGPVTVSGRSVSEAEEHLRKELGRIMTSLTGERAKTFVSVSLSRIRSIKVNMVGELVAPGTYTLSSFATLFNALYAAGGVNDIGSLRCIKVFRNSEQVASLDVYDYLLNGQYTENITLQENDMVVVIPYEQLVEVKGKLKRNRIFELKKGETLQQLLDMAGGFTGDAYTRDVQVKRKSESRYRIATIAKEEFAGFVMQDGDVLEVGAVVPFFENRLVINGAVWRPGEYELNENVHTVKQLINQAAGLKGDEFTGRAHLTRLNPDFTTTLLALDIKGILDGSKTDIELQPEDSIYVPSLFDLREAYTISVKGAVNHSDTLLPFSRNMTVEDAIIMAGGLKESAARVKVEIARRIKDPESQQSSGQIAKIFEFELDENLAIQDKEIFTLEPFDEVYVRFSPGYEIQQVVQVEGEITFAGSYALKKKNARLSDLVGNAGGLTEDAYVKGASLKRQLSDDELRRLETLLAMSANKDSRDSIGVKSLEITEYSVGIDLEKALSNPGGLDDLVLKSGDELYIPQYQSTVKISGAVTYPNSVTYTSGMSLRKGLAQAGGYNDMARKYPIVIYMNGKVATTKKVMLFFKKYPKVEPGCEIVIPTKTARDRKASLAEVMSVASSTTSMAAMVVSILNSMDK
ncbi:SLBB domain-containing protein [Parabacteroides sp. OttesenSCG-928-G06]|nr:SLBB domain-containing protein [Parabacteroides sp. OttesenSCG-928-G06]